MIKKKIKAKKVGFSPSDIGLDSDSFVNAEDVQSDGGIVMCLHALGGHGKTDWALRTTPDPIVILNHDNGLTGVVEQFLAEGKKIIVAGDPTLKSKKWPHYQVVDPDSLADALNKRDESTLDRLKKRAYPVWQRAISDYYASIESQARTIVIDTGGAWFQLGKLAFHGMSRGVTSRDDPYGQMGGEVKAIFKGLVSHGLDTGKVIIWLHRAKPEWVAGESTGNLVIDGYDQVPYEVQVAISMSTKKSTKNGIERTGRIYKSRFYGDEMLGRKFGGVDNPEMTFASVAATVTRTDEEDWTS